MLYITKNRGLKGGHRLYAAQLDLSSPLFSTQASRMCASLVGTRWAVGRPTTLLQPLPGLLLAKTVGPAVCSIATPALMRGAGCANELLAARVSFYLLSVLRKVDSEGIAVHVRARTRVRLHEQQRHLLVDAIVFCYGGFGRRRWGVGGGWVHVLNKVGVVRFIGP
jgi:hypothetical protein